MPHFQSEEPAKLRKYWVDEAVRLAMENRWEEAATANRNLLELFPEDVEALNRLGKALTELGRYAEARQAYTRALEIDRSNSIAQKNLARLANVPVDRALSQEYERVDPRLFIEETGKTGFSDLTNLASQEVLSKMTAGDQVYLRPQERALQVYNARGDYLGQVEPRLGLRLMELMRGGNKYAAALTHLERNQVRIIIREMEQHPSQAGRVSFPTRAEAVGIRPYIKGRVLDYEAEEEAEELEYVTEGEAEAEEPSEYADLDEDSAAI